MHLSGRPVASFDPEGLIFAVGVESKMVKLYDLRSFDKVCICIFYLIRENLFIVGVLFRVHLQHFMYGKTLLSVNGLTSSSVRMAS